MLVSLGFGARTERSGRGTVELLTPIISSASWTRNFLYVSLGFVGVL